jgi:ElaB/YqjD/DUF883 family membrane-anchored ribosome-binding protein
MERSTDPRDIVDDSPMAKNSYAPASAGGGGKTATEPASAVDKMKDKAPEVMQKAQKADAGIDTAAGSMESAADKIRERTQGKEGMPAEAGAKVADTMERTAGYLREHDSSEILDDVERFVREHPVQAVAGALVGGFVISRILK